MPETRKEAVVTAFVTGRDEVDQLPVFKAVLEFDNTGPLTLRFESESGQERWVRDLHRLFNCEDLVGKSCWILRCFAWTGAAIEGLEVDGYRMTVTGWLQRYAPEGESVPDPLQRAQGKAKRKINDLDRLLAKERERLAGLPRHYVSWEDNLRPPRTAFERLGEDF